MLSLLPASVTCTSSLAVACCDATRSWKRLQQPGLMYVTPHSWVACPCHVGGGGKHGCGW